MVIDMNYLTVDDIELERIMNKKQVPLITTGTGTGKTTTATSKEFISKLEEYFETNIKFPIMLEPTRNVKWQTIMNNDNAVHLTDEELIANDVDDTRVRVACFAKLGQFIADGNTIAAKPDLLILDEIDELAK